MALIKKIVPLLGVCVLLSGCFPGEDASLQDWSEIDLMIVVDTNNTRTLTGIDVDAGSLHKIKDITELTEGLAQTSEVANPTQTETFSLAVPVSENGDVIKILTADPATRKITLGEEKKDVAFPMTGDGWAINITGDGKTVGQVQLGPSQTDLTQTVDIGIVPAHIGYDKTTNRLAVVGWWPENKQKLAFVNTKTGEQSARPLPDGASGGTATHNGTTVVTLNETENNADQGQAQEGQGQLMVVQDGEAQTHQLSVSPSRVTFVDNQTIAIEGTTTTGTRQILISDLNGETKTTVELDSSAQTWGLRTVNNKTLVLQQGKIVILNQDHEIEKTLKLQGINSTTLLA